MNDYEPPGAQPLRGARRSHKEVAQQMAISPTTVRHYLRCACRMLGMHDKSQIASVLGAGSERD
ncbi:LuxR C-terminal-related transcriptional regulator [Burkholderia stagnalis]|uniref:LuxR C-terminal-related transcriptional regulator n=1 Tax=Burkholderia stagnalis TaxID=1503054 RepID=UPI0035D50E49